MDELFNSCPPMNFAALEEKILTGVLMHDNYLFYRTYHGFTGWPEADARGEAAWEFYCTACHQRFSLGKRGIKPRELDYCPECGMVVQPKKWLEIRRNLQTRLLYYEFQRGEGRQVWLHAYAVTHDFCPAPGDERLEFDERARYLFDDGKAYKWTSTFRYFGKVFKSEWTRRKRVTKTVWQRNTMSGMPPYPAFIGSIDRAVIEGSCLEYSQLDQAIKAKIDIPEYLDFYLKNPMIEYLWKFGLGCLLREAVNDNKRRDFRLAVNLRAKRPKDLLPGLTVPEVRAIEAEKRYCSVRFVRIYRELRQAGVVTGDKAGFMWADAVSTYDGAVERADVHGIRGRQLRSYIEQQARRARLNVAAMLHDYGDYLHQLDELGGGELMPDNLDNAHARLSARLRKCTDYRLTQEFRVRRRLYQWICWRHDGMLIRPVDSVQEITREGERQHNCVAGYARRHADGETIICVLRKANAPGESWHTVELDPKTLEVRQCRGCRNRDAEPEAKAFVDAWAERLKSIKFGRKTA